MKTKRAVALMDSAGDALSNMLENQHRYLPVMDDKGSLVGILDIGQCLNDAIQKLERADECSNKAAKDVVEQVATLKAGPGAHVNALQALLGPVLEQAFGNKTSPTLRSLLKGKPSTIVSPDTNVREAGIIMARDDKAALVVDSGKLVGIVTVKNIMEKAVAKQVPLELTTVTSIMTPHPLHVLPDITALEALQIMQEDRVLSLPVCEDDGTVIGSVDVMDIIYGCGGAEGWRSIFDKSALLADDVSVAVSALSDTSTPRSMTFDAESCKHTQCEVNNEGDNRYHSFQKHPYHLLEFLKVQASPVRLIRNSSSKWSIPIRAFAVFAANHLSKRFWRSLGMSFSLLLRMRRVTRYWSQVMNVFRRPSILPNRRGIRL